MAAICNVLTSQSLTRKCMVTIGGSRGRCQHPPPQQDQFLSFSHTFLPKSIRVRGWHPPTGRRPPPPPPPNGKSWIRHWTYHSNSKGNHIFSRETSRDQNMEDLIFYILCKLRMFYEVVGHGINTLLHGMVVVDKVRIEIMMDDDNLESNLLNF